MDEYMKENLDLLNDPDQWINWPVMPVKRYPENGSMQVGIVVEGDVRSGKPIVYEKNMFELVDGPLHHQVIGSPKHEYVSVEAMLNDGWMCD